MNLQTRLGERAFKASALVLFAVLLLPVLSGILALVLPAFSYAPALGHNHLNLSGFSELFSTPGFTQMVRLSVVTGVLSTTLALCITIAIVACFYQSTWLRRIERLLSPILVIPHAAAAIAIAFILTPSGMFSRLISPYFTGWQMPIDYLMPNDPYGASIVIALTLKELPFLLLMALGALAQNDLAHTNKKQFQLALTMGYGPITAFFKVVLPALYPHLRLPIFAVLVFASTNVETALILGPSHPPTLAVAIMHYFNDVDLEQRIIGSAAAVVQLLITAALLLGWLLMEKVVKSLLHAKIYDGQRQFAERLFKLVTYVCASALAILALSSFISLITWSFAGHWRFPNLMPEQWVFIHWVTALDNLFMPLMNSFVIAFCATAIACIFTLAVLEGERLKQRTIAPTLELLIYVPMLVPGIAFLFGLAWMEQHFIAAPPFLTVTLVHVVFVLPYVFLSLASSYRRLDKALLNVAASMGASNTKIFFKVILGQLKSPIFVAFALGFAISLSQYLPTLLMGAGRVNTLTTEAVAFASGGSRRLVAVYALLQMLMPLIGFIIAWSLPSLIHRFRFEHEHK